MSRRETFFNYFPTNEGAIVGWDPMALDAMTDLLRARPDNESAPRALRITILEAIAPSDADPTDVLERLRVLRSDQDVVAHYALRGGESERLLASVMAKRRGTDPDGDPYGHLVAATTLAACRTALLAWCASGGARPIGDVLASHLDVVAAGLAEPAGACREPAAASFYRPGTPPPRSSRRSVAPRRPPRGLRRMSTPSRASAHLKKTVVAAAIALLIIAARRARAAQRGGRS